LQSQSLLTPPAERARKYMDDGLVGELVHMLSRWAFTAARKCTLQAVPALESSYAHMKAFLTHPFSVMRYFCGDITHLQSFSTKPASARTGDLWCQ